MKSYLVHLMNKFFGMLIIPSQGAISVFDEHFNLLVHCRRMNHGAITCRQDYGSRHAFDLSEIPKEACPWKLKDNKIVKHDDFEKRSAFALELIKKYGYVPSIVELNKLQTEIKYEHRKAS